MRTLTYVLLDVNAPEIILTSIGAGGQATLVKSLQEEPANSAAWPTTKHTGNDVIEPQEGHSALGGQVSEDEAGLLHLSLNRTECSTFVFLHGH